MSLLALLFVSVLAGFAINLAAVWIPARIHQEEAEWIAAATGEDTATDQQVSFAQLIRGPSWRGLALMAVILTTVALSVFVALRFGVTSPNASILATEMTPKAFGMLVFVWALIALALVDIRTRFLPDVLTQPLLWLGLLVQLSPSMRTVGLESAVLGAVLGYLLLWVAAKIFLLLRNQEGLGGGDMKLMAAVGAWLGPLAIPIVLLIGSLMGLVWQVISIYRGRASKADEFAFGPWLIIAALFYL